MSVEVEMGHELKEIHNQLTLTEAIGARNIRCNRTIPSIDDTFLI